MLLTAVKSAIIKMDRFLIPSTRRPSSAMSLSDEEQVCEGTTSREVSPLTQENVASLARTDISSQGDNQIAHNSGTSRTSLSEPLPFVLQYIKSYFGPGKGSLKMKCKVTMCNKEISCAASSYNNLKVHYKTQHPLDYPAFVAALSAGSKRGRHSSGARYI